MNLRYLNTSQLSQVTGRDRRTIKTKLEGVEPSGTEGKSNLYDAHNVIPIILGIETKEEQNTYKQIQKETLRLEKAKADKIELEVAKTRGEQVPITDVASIVEKEYSAVRSQLIAIPTKMCLELSTIDDPAIIQDKLQEAINDCLTELSADKQFADNVIPDTGVRNESGTLSGATEGSGESPETKTQTEPS